MTVAELGFRMSSAEFSEWMAYAELEPFGPLRADLHAGVVASVLANVNRDPKKRREPFTPADFFPPYEMATAPSMTINDKVRAWADRHNAVFAAKRAD